MSESSSGFCLFQKSKISVLLLILILLIFIIFFHQFTGFVTNVIRFAIEIFPLTKACMCFTSYPDVVVQGTQSYFTVNTENCGNRNLSGRVVFSIINSSNNTVHQEVSDPFSLSVSEAKRITFGWTADVPTGSYSAHAKYVVNGTVLSEIQYNFEVVLIICIPGETKCFDNEVRVCSYDGTRWLFLEYCEYGCSNGACIQPPPAPQPGIQVSKPVANIYVEYPDTVEIPQGVNYTIPLKVVNIGDVILHNLNLSVKHSGNMSVSITSSFVPVLDINSSVIFSIEVSVPYNMPIGEYWIDWEISAEEISKKGRIIANITVTSLKAKCEELISHYSWLLDYMEKEIKIAEFEGADVTKLKKLIDEARDDFDIAKKFYSFGMYLESLEKLESVRKKIEYIVIELKKAKIEAIPLKKEIEMRLPLISLYILIASVFVCAAVFITVKKLRERKRRTELILPKV